MSYHINLRQNQNLHINFGFSVFSKIISRIWRDHHQNLDLFFGWFFTGCTMVNYHFSTTIWEKIFGTFSKHRRPSQFTFEVTSIPKQHALLEDGTCFGDHRLHRKNNGSVSKYQVRPLKIGRIWPQEEVGSSPFAPKMPWKKKSLKLQPLQELLPEGRSFESLGRPNEVKVAFQRLVHQHDLATWR